ncbi:hypothetical protein [Blastococcus sp. SYSU DS1021]
MPPSIPGRFTTTEMTDLVLTPLRMALWQRTREHLWSARRVDRSPDAGR